MVLVFKLLFILVLLQFSLTSITYCEKIQDTYTYISIDTDIDTGIDADGSGEDDVNTAGHHMIAVRGVVTVDPAVCGDGDYDYGTMIAFVNPTLFSEAEENGNPCEYTYKIVCVPSDTQTCISVDPITVFAVGSNGISTDPITFTLDEDPFLKIADPSASQITITLVEH